MADALERAITTAASLAAAYLAAGWAVALAARGAAVPMSAGRAQLTRILREYGEEPLGWGTAFMRLVGYMVSGFILYIGFLMIAFNPDKQGLHDKIAKTRVLKIK